ncbi:hypothetical protein DSD19_16950 [Rhodovulum sp. BSW8]|uniref:hypothetical protein n=1 Tax=Rhodovulum sp. BSW8 TaxID=2259645 RepID=UPI000DE2EA37|nr:hypothetical protein [Rhodovulum sp. BSW8]RBO51991.1 hypothetical protein DSD19_16950 [Rhodovulum sp. BSW8]
MARKPANFTQTDVTRVLKAYRNAEIPVDRCEIDPRTGKIVVFTNNAEDTVSNPWDTATV